MKKILTILFLIQLPFIMLASSAEENIATHRIDITRPYLVKVFKYTITDMSEFSKVASDSAKSRIISEKGKSWTQTQLCALLAYFYGSNQTQHTVFNSAAFAKIPMSALNEIDLPVSHNSRVSNRIEVGLTNVEPDSLVVYVYLQLETYELGESPWIQQYMQGIEIPVKDFNIETILQYRIMPDNKSAEIYTVIVEK